MALQIQSGDLDAGRREVGPPAVIKQECETWDGDTDLAGDPLEELGGWPT